MFQNNKSQDAIKTHLFAPFYSARQINLDRFREKILSFICLLHIQDRRDILRQVSWHFLLPKFPRISCISNGTASNISWLSGWVSSDSKDSIYFCPATSQCTWDGTDACKSVLHLSSGLNICNTLNFDYLWLTLPVWQEKTIWSVPYYYWSRFLTTIL